MDGGEIMVGIYCMREESVFKKRKEYKENKCMDPCLLACLLLTSFLLSKTVQDFLPRS